MSLKKRGLGRGLEVLLADTSSHGDAQQVTVAIDEHHDEPASLLQEHLQQEQLNLLQEAEALKHLIDEFELIIRAGLQ
ncbi:MAG: hypothetical protein EPN89_15945 [Methylovulum sp.]|jgi:hypothetical protein|nr:MAG: hypothetical protein EPN89_15945 [Methylovulum sp.]